MIPTNKAIKITSQHYLANVLYNHSRKYYILLEQINKLFPIIYTNI